MPRRSSPTTDSPPSWTDRAIRYAREHGWLIVPLEANSRSSPAYSEDPVEKQLDSFVHVEYPEEATSDPEEIRRFGTQFPVALIGAVTGRASDLIAVEVKHPKRESSALRDRIETLASDAPRVLGTNREYILFRHPDTATSLPRLSEEEGIVLHGEGSVIRLPWRYYKWSFDVGPLPPAETPLLSLFIEDQIDATDPKPSSDRRGLAINAEVEKQRPGGDSLPGPATTNGQPDVRPADSLFRTGQELRLSSNGRTPLTLPWTVPGGLSLLTAPPKTGKSTWALNLAAHQAVGQPFLEEEAGRSDVVLLSDTSSSNFRRLLQRIDVLQPDDLSRLHVLHSRDVCDLDWRTTLHRVYRRVEEVGAKLVVIDCLDRYVRLKGGGIPMEAEEVVHALTAEAPPECAVLAVKSSDCSAREPIVQTIHRLGLLGRAADTFLRLDDVSNASLPSLRRLVAKTRTDRSPQTLFCALRQGGYIRVRQRPTDPLQQGDKEPSSPDRTPAPEFDSLPT